MKKYNKRTVFYSWVSSYVCLSVVLIIIYTPIMFVFKNKIVGQNAELNKYMLSESAYIFDSYIDQAQKSALSVLYGNFIDKYEDLDQNGGLSQYLVYENREYFHNILRSNPNVDNIAIYFTDNNYIVSKHGIFDANDYFDSYYTKDMESFKRWEDMISGNNDMFLFDYAVGKKLIYKIDMSKFIVNQKKNCIVFSEIEELTFLVKMQEVYNKTQNNLIVTDKVTKNSISYNYDEYSKYISFDCPGANANLGYSLAIKKDKYFLSLNLIYMMYMSILMGFVISCLLAWYFSRKHYKPVKKLLTNYLKSTDEKNINEFEIIEMYTKDIDVRLGKFERDKMMLNFLNEVYSEEDILKISEYYDTFVYEKYVVAVIMPNHESVEALKNNKYTQNDIRAIFTNIIEEMQVKAFVDGKLIEEKSTSDEYIFDLSNCNLGKHTICIQAEDDNGAISEEERTTIVVIIEEKIETSYDFEDYVTSNPMGGKTNGGTFTPDTVDDEHGTSLGVVVDQNTPDGWGGPYTEVGTAETTDIVIIKFDFRLTLASMQVHFETRGEAKTSDFEIKNGYLSVHNGSAVSLSAMKWYEVEYTFYPQQNKFDFMLRDGDNVVCQYKGLSSKTANVKKFSGFRIYVDGRTQQQETVYIDNVSLAKKNIYPYVEKIYGESTTEGVEYSDKNLFVEFFGEIVMPEEFEITLENEMGIVPIESIQALQGNIIKITPRYNLESASNYRIVFGDNLLCSDGKPIGKKTEGMFKTSSKQFDVVEGTFSDSSELFFTTEIDNTTDKDEEITVIMIVYKNGVFNRVLSKKQTVYANQTIQISTPTVDNETGFTAKGFVIYNDNKKPISNKIYQYN